MSNDLIKYPLERAAKGIGFEILIVDGMVTLPISVLNDLVKEAEENGARDATLDG